MGAVPGPSYNSQSLLERGTPYNSQSVVTGGELWPFVEQSVLFRKVGLGLAVHCLSFARSLAYSLLRLYRAESVKSR